MQILIKCTIVSFFLLISLLCGCLTEDETDNFTEEKQKVLLKFDGYQWSWYCWSIENNFTLWGEHITNIEKIGDYCYNVAQGIAGIK